MSDRTFLTWPFFDERHRDLAAGAAAWWLAEGAGLPDGEAHGTAPGEPSRDSQTDTADGNDGAASVAPAGHTHATDRPAGGADAWTACREIVRRLGDAGWLRHVVPAVHAASAPAPGPRGGHREGHDERAERRDRTVRDERDDPGATTPPVDLVESAPAGEPAALPEAAMAASFDVRSLCLLRETFAYGSALADFAFALQGLGSAPISLFGTAEQRRRYLPAVAAGRAIPAFALSEADAGSDVAALRTTARRAADGSYVLDGEKTWISNAGIADFYVVFCRLDDGMARRGSAGNTRPAFAAFVVDADHPDLRVTARLTVNAPHPMGTVTFENCRLPASAMVGEPGRGLRVALATLDAFRPTVGAAALGLARRALDEAVAHAATRHAFGQPLAAHQLIQAKIADMATAIDASALLVYRAAWTRDHGAARITREAAMAKLFATEAAQHVIDDAVQILGARGVLAGATVERLYREVRALRIYEGTSEIQRLVIAGQVMAQSAADPAHPAPGASAAKAAATDSPAAVAVAAANDHTIATGATEAPKP